MEYRTLFETGKERLERAGIAEAALDARLLLEYTCGTDRNVLLAHPEREVSPEEEMLYRERLSRRAQRVPLQQITGEQEFMGLSFKVNETVLIPRQDTEILVEEVLREPFDGADILDMCTGSGCILLSLLRYSNECHGVGVDISEAALGLARENAARLGIPEEQARFVQGDLFDGLRENKGTDGDGKFDVLVSNPPYIRTEVIPALMPEVREHEPLTALDGGIDGLLFYRRIAENAGAYLRRGARLYFEIGCEQAADVEGILASAGFEEIRIYKDYAGLDRVVSARKTE